MKKFDELAKSISSELLRSEGIHQADRHFRLRVLNAVFNLLGPVDELNAKTILDVGGGPASYTSSLGGLFSYAVCLDLSSTMLMKGKERATALKVKVEFVKADAENLPFNDKSFDYVVAFATIHHVPNWEKCLRNMTRVAKEKLIVLEPNGASVPHLANELLMFYRPSIKKWKITGEWKFRELHHLTPWRIRRQFEESGLTKVRLKFIGFIPEFWPMPNFALKFLVLIEKAFERIPILNLWAGSVLASGTKA